MKLNPYDWLDCVNGQYRLNDRSLQAGAGALNMSNRGGYKIHLSAEWEPDDGAQLCGHVSRFHWQYDVSVGVGELSQLCSKCFAVLARNAKGGE